MAVTGSNIVGENFQSLEETGAIISNQWKFVRRIFSIFGIFLAAQIAPASPPNNFVSRGPGGGGAFFGPAINPYNPDDVWVGSDMSDLFHSMDFGRTWDTVDFRTLQGGNQMPCMAWTSDPKVRYALNGGTIVRSYDSGATWSNTPAAFYSYVLFADPTTTNRVIASNYSTLYISTDSASSFSPRWTNSNGLLIGGAFFDGTKIYVGTQDGLLVSTNNGAKFSLTGSGIGAGESMISFAGGKENNTSRFFCVTWVSGDVYPGIQGSGYSSFMKVYRLDGGTGNWAVATTGLGANKLFEVAMSPTNIGIAYIAGSDGAGQPSVVKTVNGGASWSQVMNCSGNANVATGWSGDDAGGWNWKKWSYGECAEGFTICASDPNRAVFTDFGFIHITTNGGASWRQAYDWTGTENAAGAMTPKTNFYTGNGAEDTSCWHLSWFTSNTLFCSFTDMRGMLSTNAGRSWMSPMTLGYNSTYMTVKHPTNGIVYGAMSSVHDMYAWDKYCGDSAIDGGTGEIMYSTNNGATWATFKNLGKPVVGLALDPNNPNRLYATVVNSATGGVYRTTNLNAGTSSTWTKLASPPRTQGHAYNIVVLNDGTLVATYSARIASDFQASSGVFVSTNDGAAWLDRTSAGMMYYTKDITIDPADPSQNTWYAGVWGEWGASANLGGLYVTTNRGVSWTRRMTNISVGSCTASPSNTNDLYITTENDGLWICTNRFAAAPTFTQLAGYPFRFPSRVFFNPYDANEVWVTSFGNGMRLGRISEPKPTISNFQNVSPTSLVTVAASPGQKVVVTASPDLAVWSPLGTNIMFTDTFTFGAATSATNRFFRAEVR